MAFPNGRPRPRDGHEHRNAKGWQPEEENTQRLRRDISKHRHWVSDRYEALLDGRLDISDLDDDEIRLGRLRNSVGTFSGRPPRLIPYTLHGALRESMEQRMERRIIAVVPELIDRLVSIVENPRAAAAARVQAGTWLIERAIGKTVDRKQISAELKATWETAAETGKIFVDIEVPDEDKEVVEALVIESDAKEIPTPPPSFKAPPPVLDPRAQGAIELIQPGPSKPERPRKRVTLG